MAQTIFRSGVVDQSSAGTIVYTAPIALTATVSGLSIYARVDTTITVSNFVFATTITTSYTVDLKASDSLTDSAVYALAAQDYVKVESTNPGASYTCSIVLP
jgi:hypothetical protein